VDLANRAAKELMNPRDGNLVGNPIAAFLPELHHALRLVIMERPTADSQ
jgi:hypothetical protein